MLQDYLRKFNSSRLWHRHLNLWGLNYQAPTADRLLALWLHRIGMMGSQEVALFRTHIHLGMSVLDIGANQGIYSLLFAKLVGDQGKVFAFEPEPGLFESLTRNGKLNRADNLTCYQIALGDRPGKLTLQRSLLNSGDNRISVANWTSGGLDVDVLRLDDAAEFAPVDFVKIDVQGYEMHTFAGMERTLAKSPSVKIFFEFWPYGLRQAGTQPINLLRFLQDRGFRLYPAWGSFREELLDFEHFELTTTGKRYTNLLAVK